MEILVFLRTYNSFGGHPVISLIGGYLELDMPDFGSALEQIEVYIALKTDTWETPSLQSLHEDFHKNIGQFSGIKFFRTKKRLELRYVGRANGDDIEANEWRTDDPNTCSLFQSSTIELVQKLELIRQKIKPSDNFDFVGFSEWVQKKLDSLPHTAQELEGLFTQIRTHNQKKRAGQDEWKKLCIDFEDFHRNARKILDDPFFWDVTNDFSPNGNDTGADLLEMYRDWRKKCRGVAAFWFYKQVLRGWGINPEAGDDDGIDKTTADEAAIGIAFAQIKLEARCEPEILKVALYSLARQRRAALSADDSWKFRQECLESLDRVEKKLLEIQNLPAPKPRRPKQSPFGSV